jgi:hypothetical protein
MSSTTGVQNLLVNVFRPYYVYEGSLFTPKIEMSNIDTYTGNSIAVSSFSFGDSNQNVYVGPNAGNSATDPKNSFSNVALGYAAGGGVSNTTNSIFLGYETGINAVGASNITAIGANTDVGPSSTNSVFIGNDMDASGTSNVFLGSGIVGRGTNNVFVGAGITTGTTSTSNQFRVGSNYLYGDLSNRWLGVGTPTQSASTVNMDVSGVLQATGGFSSTRGTIVDAGAGSSTTIATLKKGVILVSAQDASTTDHYQTIQVFCPDPTTGATTTAMTNVVQAGEVSILFPSTSNIEISNATTIRNIAWSVTYFPLP